MQYTTNDNADSAPNAGLAAKDDIVQFERLTGDSPL
jgi:hypothetical protein